MCYKKYSESPDTRNFIFDLHLTCIIILVYTFLYCFARSKFSKRKIKKSSYPLYIKVYENLKCGCGGRTWTNDLRVMSPTSYQLLYSAIFTLLSSECPIIIHLYPQFVNTFFTQIGISPYFNKKRQHLCSYFIIYYMANF